MTTQSVATTLSLGNATIGYLLPFRQNLTLFHLPNTNYRNGSAMVNLGIGGPTTPSAIIGSPVFDSLGMTVNNLGDGLQSVIQDIQSDLTVFALAQDLDSSGGTASSPVYVSTFVNDTAAPTGNKGFSLNMVPNAGNIGTVASVARTSNVVTLTLSTAVSPVYVVGQYLTVSGVTLGVDPSGTMNGYFQITGISGLTITYASVGVNVSTTTVSGVTCWNGAGRLNLNDQILVSGTLTPTQTRSGANPVYNVPRFLAATVVASTGVRTLYDLSSGGLAPYSATTTGTRVGLTAGQAIAFGTSVNGTNSFGKCKIFACGCHIGAALSQAQLQANYLQLQSKLGVG